MITISPTRPWVLPGLAFAGEIAMPRAVRKVLRKRRPMRPSKWAERHRVVRMSSLPGPWRNDVTPYTAGIMDAAAFESVEDIILCKAPQTGGSEAVNNFTAYAADRMPGPVLYIFPDQLTAKENSKDRIQPMFEDSARLREYVTGAEDDMASFRVNLIHMPIYMAWANSASRLANKPIMHLVCEETDKYPETANKREAGPISLGEKRTNTYKGRRKRWKLSTPTVESGPIWQALTKEAEAVFDFWVRCPFCNKAQIMIFDQIKWPADERDPRVIVSKNLARYECPHCRWRWSDEDRNRAVRRGVWRERIEESGDRSQESGDRRQRSRDRSQETEVRRQRGGLTLRRYLLKRRPRAIGFHIPSWLSRFIGLSEVAAAFLKGQKDKTLLKDFMNNHKALPWRAYKVERKDDAIIALKDDRPRGVIPGGAEGARLVAGLTAAVDTQDNGFYYEIRAWGYGVAEESWQVREGFLAADWRKIQPGELAGRSWAYHSAFDALRQVLWEDQYRDAAGNEYVVHFAVIDAMGHQTSEVYDFCRHHKGRVLALQGVDRMTDRYRYADIDRYPGKNKPIPGGVKLLRVNVTHYKGRLSERLAVAPADPGAWHMHAEMADDWAAQMCAEYVNEKGFWEVISDRANHAWDVSVYNLACADVIGIRHWARPEAGDQRSEARGRRVISKGRGGDWVPKKKDWVKRR